jgi:Ni/Co efflux regulator RcnB
MKQAILLAATAAVALAWASAGWAAPNDQGAGGPQGQSSNHAAPKGQPSVQTSKTGPAGAHAGQHGPTTALGAPAGQPRLSTTANAHTPVAGPGAVQSRQVQHVARQQPATAFSTTHRTTVTTSNTGPANVMALRRNAVSTHRYHAPAYQPPYGYVAHSWRYGQHLPTGYYARNYWITDFLVYALFAPPRGYVWVRVGDDALLINQNTGEIIAVEQRSFY